MNLACLCNDSEPLAQGDEEIDKLRKLPCDERQRIFDAVTQSFDSQGDQIAELGLLFGTANSDRISGLGSGEYGSFPRNRYLVGQRSNRPGVKFNIGRDLSNIAGAYGNDVTFDVFMHVQGSPPNPSDFPGGFPGGTFFHIDSQGNRGFSQMGPTPGVSAIVGQNVSSIVLTPDSAFFIPSDHTGFTPSDYTSMGMNEFRDQVMEGCDE